MFTGRSTYKLRLVILIIASFCIISCNQSSLRKERTVERAFYFWKSVFNLNEYEKNTLADLHVNTLYMKFFDVDWDNNLNQPLPVAQIRIKETEIFKKDSLNIIPVVFITNSCIRHIDSSQAEDLGIKISTLVNNICDVNQLNFHELQIDCDWTELTKENYFILLRSIKKRQDNNKSLSATIRLYQIKYRNKTGTPPVDRGLLMAYNMGDLKAPSSNNSILESKELKKYVSDLSTYPLQLDVALPLFEWKVLFRNNIYSGLIENLPDSFLNNSSVKNISENHFKFLRDTVLNGYSFIKGDMLRKEESTYEEILSAEKILGRNLTTLNLRVALFHLDSLILKKYKKNEIEDIFNGLH